MKYPVRREDLFNRESVHLVSRPTKPVKLQSVILMTYFLLCISFRLCCQVQDSTQVKEKKILELLQNIKKLTTEDSLQNIKRSPADSLSFEIDQLIINETISKLGLDFQDIFYNKWNWPPRLSYPFIIIISERPVFGNNTQIEIIVNDIKVFESFLQPRYEVLEEIAMQAVDITTQYVLNFQEVLKQLGGDDMKGTGIY